MLGRTVSSLICFFLLAVAIPAQAVELVVVLSTAPNLKLGQIINAGDPLNLAAGESITLASESGKMTLLKGPHSGPSGIVDDGIREPDLVGALSKLLSGTTSQTIRLGAMRGGDSGPPPNQPWVVNTGKAGDQCVQEGKRTLLWRSQHAKATILTLKNVDDGSKAVIKWPPLNSTLAWPNKTTRSDGANYQVHLKGVPTRRRFVLHLVPASLLSTARRAVWMEKKGCINQAKRLLASEASAVK